jgi:selenocysteine-specific elongation factor
VDRVFTVEGTGTVVTGTVHAGAVDVGDELVLAPGAGAPRRIRVRGVHANNRAVARAGAGVRCALRAGGRRQERSAAASGWWRRPLALATARLDARLALWSGEARVLRAGTPVHVHVGAEATLGSVALLDEGESLAPGAQARVQLVLRQPIGAWHGDRVVLRDASASRTLAGGTVLDPFAPARYRRTPQRLAELAAWRAARRCRAPARAAGGGPLRRGPAALARRRGRLTGRGAARRRARAPRPTASRRRPWARRRPRPRAAQVRAGAGRLPPAPARRARARRGAAAPPGAAAPARAAVARAARRPRRRRAGRASVARRSCTCPSTGCGCRRWTSASRRRSRRTCAAAGYEGAWARDLARDTGESEPIMRVTLARLAQRGEVHQVVRDLVYSETMMRELARLAREVAAAQAGSVTAAAFRDATRLGRKRAIQILEHFDRVGLLRRVGDVHRAARRQRCSSASTGWPRRTCPGAAAGAAAG